MINEETTQELSVTFAPQLFLQRRRWVFETMAREGVNSVVDIGCGEGETVACLYNPAPWRAPLILPEILADDDTNVSGAADTLHITSIHALDVSESSLDYTAKAITEADNTTRWMKHLRWEPLDVKLWHGGLESFNPGFVGVDCIISTEVIEHLPEDILPQFAPMLLGVYHPRLLLITTPSYTFNARFTAPDAPESARSGYKDPTGRTKRIFRHSDHKFEWTQEEFVGWCTSVAENWGYEVEVSGVGKAEEKDMWGRDEQLGWASQVAAFRRRDDDVSMNRRADESACFLKTIQQGRSHRKIAELHFAQHESAGRYDSSLDQVSSFVKTTMQRYQQPKATVHEYWFEEEIGIGCGGHLQRLIQALELDDGLLLHQKGRNPLDWIIEFTGLVVHAGEQEPKITSEKQEGRAETSDDEMDNTSEGFTQWTGQERAPAEDPSVAWHASSHIVDWQSDSVGWGRRSCSPEGWGNWGTDDWKDSTAVENEVRA